MFVNHFFFIFRGLAKLDCAWDDLPTNKLEAALIRCGDSFTSQEIANIVYGFGQLGCSWTDLSANVHQILCNSISQNIPRMTAQEYHNIMYSICLMSFDCNYDFSILPKNYRNSKKTNIESMNEDNSNSISESDISYGCLYDIHITLLKEYFGLTNYIIQTYDDGFDQVGVYFATLLEIKGGKQLVHTIGHEIPILTGPAPNIPSRFHADVIHSTQNYLNSIDMINQKKFFFCHEFNGLPSSVFPLDTAIWYQNELLAFIEIDGEFHYQGTKLRRKDQLKEYLYHCIYPNMKFIRIRADQFQKLGKQRIGMDLGNWLLILAKVRDESL